VRACVPQRAYSSPSPIRFQAILAHLHRLPAHARRSAAIFASAPRAYKDARAPCALRGVLFFTPLCAHGYVQNASAEDVAFSSPYATARAGAGAAFSSLPAKRRARLPRLLSDDTARYADMPRCAICRQKAFHFSESACCFVTHAALLRAIMPHMSIGISLVYAMMR